MTAFRPRHLSVSSVALYVTCPAQFRRRYVDRLVTPTNPPMSFGIAFHAALEAEHRGQDSERALIAEWNKRQDILTAAQLGTMPSKTHALALLDEYKRLGLGGKIGHPERKFVRRLPMANVPVPVLGYVDLSLPERRRFRENKTSSTTTWTREKAQSERQLHVYGWDYQQTYHHRAECAEYVIFRTDIVQVDVLEVAPSADGMRLFETEAEAVWHGIVNERYDGCGACELCKPPVARPDTGPVVTFDD
jgi:hypothetical protein